MYQIEEIEHLAQQYVGSESDEVFEGLINALIPLIDMQSARKYPDLKEYWDDMKQEVLLKLWKNRRGLLFTTDKKLYRFLYRRIFRDLFRAVKRIKKDYIIRNEQFNAESLDVRKHEKLAESIWG